MKFSKLIEKYSENTAKLPIFASAVAEFHDKRAYDVQQFTAESVGDEEVEPVGGTSEEQYMSFAFSGAQYVPNVIPLPEGTSYYGISCGYEPVVLKPFIACFASIGKNQYKNIVEALTVGDQYMDILGPEGQLTVAVADVLDSIESAYVSSVVNSEIFRTIATSPLSDKPDVAGFMARLTSRINPTQIQSVQSQISAVVNSPKVSNVFEFTQVLNERPDINGYFDYDNYTDVNAFASAMVSIANGFIDSFNAAFAGVRKLGEIIVALGKTFYNLIEWLVSKLFRQLFVDYTLNENSKSLALDVPTFSYHGTIPNLVSHFVDLAKDPEEVLYDVSSYGLGCNDRFKTAVWAANPQAWRDNIQDILENYFNESNETKFLTFPMDNFLIVITEINPGELYVLGYSTGYGTTCTYDDDVEDFIINTEQITLNNTEFTNTDIAKTIIDMTLLSTGDSGLQSYVVVNDEYDHKVLSNLYMEPISLSIYQPDHNTPTDLIDSIRTKNGSMPTSYVAVSTEVDEYNKTPNNIMINILMTASIVLGKYHSNGVNWWKDVLVPNNATIYDFGGSISNYAEAVSEDEDISDYFIPYCTYNVMDSWIHPQTDSERTKEAMTVILTVAAAAALTLIAVKALKFKKKWNTRIASNVGKMRSAENALALNPNDKNAQKMFLKAKKRNALMNKVSSAFGLGSKASSTTSDDYNGQFGVILGSISGENTFN